MTIITAILSTFNTESFTWEPATVDSLAAAVAAHSPVRAETPVALQEIYDSKHETMLALGGQPLINMTKDEAFGEILSVWFANLRYGIPFICRGGRVEYLTIEDYCHQDNGIEY